MRWMLAAAVCLAGAAARANPTCHGISVTTLAFGNYDVYSTTPLDTAGTIFYSCPPPILPTVEISAGNGGSYSPRLMQLAGGTETLQYNVYVDAARTTVWGATPISVPQGNALSVPFYGRIFAGQDVSVGSYSDTLIVTFNF
jgi:spore coat protein U-like protein